MPLILSISARVEGSGGAYNHGLRGRTSFSLGRACNVRGSHTYCGLRYIHYFHKPYFFFSIAEDNMKSPIGIKGVVIALNNEMLIFIKANEFYRPGVSS